MCFDMFCQVIASHEAFVTHGTGESLFTGVGSQMSLQFIGTGKTFATE